jgi:ATP-dependent Clp protease protease subunit
MTLRFDSRIELRDGELHGALYLYDVIGEGIFFVGISAELVVRSLDQLRDAGARHLDVYVNSPGGEVFAGVAIRAELARWDRGKKTVYVDGLCASIASVIAMAGDRVHVAMGAMFMVHDPASWIRAGAAGLRKEADLLDTMKESIVDIYTAATGLDRARVAQLMAEETWMSAREAVDLGFADEVTDDEANRELPAALATSKTLPTMFNSLPESALAVWRQRQPRIGASAEEEDMSEQERRALAAALGLPADASAEQCMAGVNKTASRAKICAVLLTQLQVQPDASEQEALGAVMRLQNPVNQAGGVQLKELQTELETLRNQARDRDARDAVAGAQQQRKVGGADHPQYAWAIAYAKADPVGFQTWLTTAPEIIPAKASQRTEEQRQAPGAPGGAAPVSARQKKFNAQLGVSAEEFEKYKNSGTQPDDDDEEEV